MNLYFTNISENILILWSDIMVKLNSNKEIVNMVQTAIKDSGGYCPCQINTKCPCDKFKKQDSGMCYCELYEKC